MRILHVIIGLNDGGAEGVLSRLCISDNEHEHIVLSMTDLGKYGLTLRSYGIQVRMLRISTLRSLPKAIIEFRQVLIEIKPDLVQTWMYHANVFAGLLTKIFFYKKPVYWNIRCTVMKLREAGLATSLIVYMGSILSYFIPACIIVCGNSAKSDHQHIGYKRSKLKIIQNGFDLEYFRPPKNLLRNNTNFSETKLNVGIIGRFHPQKNHGLAFKACSLAMSKGIKVQLHLAGSGMTIDQPLLNNSIHQYNMEGITQLYGALQDIRPFLNGIDVLLLPSEFGEGFPNVLAEAMAYSIPCISTPIGDSEEIVGKIGWIVSTKKPEEIVLAFEEIIAMKKNKTWPALKNAARQRIERNFSISKMMQNYSKCWKEF